MKKCLLIANLYKHDKKNYLSRKVATYIFSYKIGNIYHSCGNLTLHVGNVRHPLVDLLLWMKMLRTTYGILIVLRFANSHYTI